MTMMDSIIFAIGCLIMVSVGWYFHMDTSVLTTCLMCYGFMSILDNMNIRSPIHKVLITDEVGIPIDVTLTRK